MHPINCDTCGRFFRVGEPGSSWVMVPGIEVPGHESGDERERCANCTAKHGPAVCGPAYKKELCCGIYGAEASSHGLPPVG